MQVGSVNGGDIGQEACKTLNENLYYYTAALLHHDFLSPGGATILQMKPCCRVVFLIHDFPNIIAHVFWHQNYALANVSLKTHVVSANIS